MRLILAAAQAVADLGAGDVAVVDIVARAGVSRKTFYELFADRDQCLLAAFEEALARVAREVLPVWGVEAEWASRVRGALAGILGFIDREPGLAELLLASDSVGVLARRRLQVLSLLADAIDEGRALRRAPGNLTALTAEGLVGAVLAIVRARRLAGERVGGLLGELMAIVVLPYRGPAAAARQQRLPVQRKHSPPAAAATTNTAAAAKATVAESARVGAVAPVANPFKDLGVRVTYRTVRVLAAIAELSETGVAPSNTQVASQSGVADLGQMSKLMARLGRAGLIENTAACVAGGAYAWRLTERGLQVSRAIAGRQADDA